MESPAFYRLDVKPIRARLGRRSDRVVRQYIKRDLPRFHPRRRSLSDARDYMSRVSSEDAKKEVLFYLYKDGGSGLAADRLFDESDKANRRKVDGHYKQHAGKAPVLGLFITGSFSKGTALDAARTGLETFMDFLTTEFGIAGEAVIHQKSNAPDHFHIVTTDRYVGPGGVGKKNRHLNGVAQLASGNVLYDGDVRLVPGIESMRAAWASILRETTGNQDIDHRSYKRRGLDLEPLTVFTKADIDHQMREGTQAWREQRDYEKLERVERRTAIPPLVEQVEREEEKVDSISLAAEAAKERIDAFTSNIRQAARRRTRAQFQLIEAVRQARNLSVGEITSGPSKPGFSANHTLEMRTALSWLMLLLWLGMRMTRQPLTGSSSVASVLRKAPALIIFRHALSRPNVSKRETSVERVEPASVRMNVTPEGSSSVINCAPEPSTAVQQHASATKPKPQVSYDSPDQAKTPPSVSLDAPNANKAEIPTRRSSDVTRTSKPLPLIVRIEEGEPIMKLHGRAAKSSPSPQSTEAKRPPTSAPHLNVDEGLATSSYADVKAVQPSNDRRPKEAITIFVSDTPSDQRVKRKASSDLAPPPPTIQIEKSNTPTLRKAADPDKRSPGHHQDIPSPPSDIPAQAFSTEGDSPGGQAIDLDRLIARMTKAELILAFGAALYAQHLWARRFSEQCAKFLEVSNDSFHEKLVAKYAELFRCETPFEGSLLTKKIEESVIARPDLELRWLVDIGVNARDKGRTSGGHRPGTKSRRGTGIGD